MVTAAAGAQMKIVHFDLKPDNLLLEAPLVPGAGLGVPSVKVADFGLSKHKWKSYVSGVRDLRCAPCALYSFWDCKWVSCGNVRQRPACHTGPSALVIKFLRCHGLADHHDRGRVGATLRLDN